MGLKANSLNTNLRAHGFQITDTSTQEVMQEFGTLPDLKNWKMRYNATAPFCSSSTDAEAEMIQMQGTTARPALVLVPAAASTNVIPENLKALLRGKDEIEREVQRLVMEIDGVPPLWRATFLERVTAQWLSMCGQETEIGHPEFVYQVMSNASPPIPQGMRSLVEANLHHIIGTLSNWSVINESVLFVDFVRLVLRFGLLDRIANAICEVSDSPPDSQGSQLCSWVYLSQIQSQRQSRTSLDVQACFAPWFLPTSDQNTARERMNQGFEWVVRYANVKPTFFTIQSKKGGTTIATHIRHNPMPLYPNERLSVTFEGGEMACRGTWMELLVDVLALTMPMFRGTPVTSEKVEYVCADAVIARRSPEIPSFGGGVEMPEVASSDFESLKGDSSWHFSQMESFDVS
jgi:hypothetical protein